MSHVVMALDVIHVHGFCDARLLIEVKQVAVEIGVIHDATKVALEVGIINCIEAHERAKESPIRFHNAVSKQIAILREAVFQLIQSRKKLFKSLLINLL